ncbi:hypothetical protein PENTCL1PPCAC_16751, partial [Pristionchus entomophagus]
GFNREEIEHKNMKFTIWDIHMPAPEIGLSRRENGETRILDMWKPYFEATQALIYVVDSSESEYMDRARDELLAMLCDPIVAGRKLLVFANEKNAETSLTTTQLIERLDLKSVKGRKWHIHRCNAKTGESLRVGLDWF